jgi:mRNA interferase RelE/StbE
MSILYSKQAAKAISGMDVITKQRIKEGIDGIPNGDIKPLRGSEGNFRLRVGDWRVLFSCEVDGIRIKKIAPRGDVYKGV